ncbi:MAG: DUF362 domain-containing protein [Halobacteriota archaeon]
MASAVYFARLKAGGRGESIIARVQQLFDAARFDRIVASDAPTAIKIHFGERGNDSYIHPVFVRQVADKIKACGGKPFITDTNTLYTGARHNAVDHVNTAIEHGFDYAVVGAPLVIADGLTGDYYRDVHIGKKHFESVKIAGGILSAPSMIVMSHFTGHAQSGFGGAIKNLGMGCAPPAGKMDQHKGMLPTVDEERCVACGVCIEACPHGARTLEDGVSRVNRDLCSACGQCMIVCTTSSIGFDLERDQRVFIEMLTEYALGARIDKHAIGYFNFLLQTTPDCDCVPWSDAPIVPDVGILASVDPVAIDAASLDLINQQQGLSGTRLTSNFAPGEDKFKGIWGKTEGALQLAYGEEIGLGTRSYDLVEL